MICNLSLSVSEKYGMSCLGFRSSLNEEGTVQTLDEQDGRIISQDETGSFSTTLPCMLSYAEKMIPLFAIPSVRIQLTLASLSEIFASGTGAVIPSGFNISNVELCYRTVNLGSEVEQMVKGMGDKIFVKSQSFVNSAQYLAGNTSGSLALVYNQRLASVKSAFIIGAGTHSSSVNKWGDSYALSSACDYAINVGGINYPQRSLSTVRNKAGIMQELREAVGSIYDRKNAISVNRVEFDRVCGDISTPDQPAKFYVGINLEKINSEALLTGISTANSPITLLINSSVATSQALNMHLVLNYDALMQIDPNERTIQILM